DGEGQIVSPAEPEVPPASRRHGPLVNDRGIGDVLQRHAGRVEDDDLVVAAPAAAPATISPRSACPASSAPTAQRRSRGGRDRGMCSAYMVPRCSPPSTLSRMLSLPVRWKRGGFMSAPRR